MGNNIVYDIINNKNSQKAEKFQRTIISNTSFHAVFKYLQH
jgi:hypothetical protein